MTSRLINDAFIPCVPMVMPSLMAMVLNSMGVPPAARIPDLTWTARSRRWKLHGIVSTHVLATPTMGRRSSCSEKPIPLRYERAAARSGPSRRMRLRLRGSGCMTAHDTGLPCPADAPPPAAHRYLDSTRRAHRLGGDGCHRTRNLGDRHRRRG